MCLLWFDYKLWVFFFFFFLTWSPFFSPVSFLLSLVQFMCQVFCFSAEQSTCLQGREPANESSALPTATQESLVVGCLPADPREQDMLTR